MRFLRQNSSRSQQRMLAIPSFGPPRIMADNHMHKSPSQMQCGAERAECPPTCPHPKTMCVRSSSGRPPASLISLALPTAPKGGNGPSLRQVGPSRFRRRHSPPPPQQRAGGGRLSRMCKSGRALGVNLSNVKVEKDVIPDSQCLRGVPGNPCVWVFLGGLVEVCWHLLYAASNQRRGIGVDGDLM